MREEGGRPSSCNELQRTWNSVCVGQGHLQGNESSRRYGKFGGGGGGLVACSIRGRLAHPLGFKKQKKKTGQTRVDWHG